MDGDVEAAPLELTRGGETDGAGSDDGGLPGGVRLGQLGHEEARPPRERDARAAVSVVVDHGLVVQPLGGHAEARWTEGSQPHGGPDDTIG